MINIENEIYTILATELESAFPSINVTGEYTNTPPGFPCVSITESDNYTAANRLDSSPTEKYGVLMYEINVYSNKAYARKSECKAIMQVIDSKLLSLNFIRLALTPVPNLFDASVYRMTARYRAESDGANIYRR